MNFEAIRQSFKPKRIKLLFIGESPPASGKFFYCKSAMTTFTSHAFERAYGKNFSNTNDFLCYFKSCGCFLDDLNHKSVETLPMQERDELSKKAVRALTKRIRTANPLAIIVVLKRIETYIREATSKFETPPEIFVLPFPWNGHQNKYIDELIKILKKAHLSGVLRGI